MKDIKKTDKRPSLRIAIRYSITATLVTFLTSLLIPILLNYGPEVINSDFDVKMSGIAYWQQYLCVGLMLIVLLLGITRILFKDVDKFYMSKDPNKYNDVELIKKVRKRCFSLPYLIPMFEILVPVISSILVLALTGSHVSIMLLKILIVAFSATLILAVLSFIFSKGIYNEILSKTYKEDVNTGLRVNLKSKILLQLLPLIIFCILILTFLGYSSSVREEENVYFNIYNKVLNENFSDKKFSNYEEIYEVLNNIHLFSDSHSSFIIKPDNTVITLHGEEPSSFAISYTQEIAQKYNGRTYDTYGVDSQGKTLKISTPEGDYYVGIIFNIESNGSVDYLLICSCALLIISTFILYVFSSSLSDDISEISNSFEKLCSNEFGKTLPVTTNDEIGDLIHSFNEVQKYSQNQLELIQNNQERLMERERLATLGQMVGGIAHNLKTPIMSISGATEGLKDLINEYQSSVGDPDVTVSDHHEIASDMTKWVDKINTYTEYMSDIITAVKGQAVTLSNQEIVSFTIGELIKRVDILMKHELKHSLTTLNVKLDVDENLTLKGDINSLVQVLNNLISNAIQSYNGKENNSIDMNLKKTGSQLTISVRDYGSGISKEVQDRLFREMVTTKGKNGTGLGLFMSYSNIRAHFNGNMSFTSEEGKGTTFKINIPLE